MFCFTIREVEFSVLELDQSSVFWVLRWATDLGSKSEVDLVYLGLASARFLQVTAQTIKLACRRASPNNECTDASLCL